MKHEEPMRINAPRGQRIRFNCDPDANGNGKEYDVLVAGEIYTVDHTIVYKDSSYVIVQEIKERKFNTVEFTEVSPHMDATQTGEEIYIAGVRQRMKNRIE